MDLLNSDNATLFIKPSLIDIGGCTFRSFEDNVSHGKTSKEKNDSSASAAPYLEYDDEMVNCAELDDDIEIKLTKSGQYMTELHAPDVYFSAVIGKGGSIRKSIEMDTNAFIKVPKIGDKGNIIIKGASERSVISAYSRIQMVIFKARDKQQITHFVSIPVLSPNIQRNYQNFKSSILNGPPLRGVDETIFQDPEKFHLTIVTLVLLDDTEKELALETLRECQDDIIKPLFQNTGALKVTLEGIEIMNDDPADANVLYGKVSIIPQKFNSSIQKMADDILDRFTKKGLIRKQYDSVKLHVTLINSRYRKTRSSETESKQHGKNRESFDASIILEKFKTYHFGETDLNNIHLSVRFSTGNDNYYESLTTIPYL